MINRQGHEVPGKPGRHPQWSGLAGHTNHRLSKEFPLNCTLGHPDCKWRRFWNLKWSQMVGACRFWKKINKFSGISKTSKIVASRKSNMLLFEQMPESLTTNVLFPACRLLKMGNDWENPGMPMQRKMWVLVLQNAVDVSRVLAYLGLRQMTPCLFSSFLLFSLPTSSRHLCSSNVHHGQRSAGWCWLPLVPPLAESGHRLGWHKWDAKLGGHQSILQPKPSNKKCSVPSLPNFWTPFATV